MNKKSYKRLFVFMWPLRQPVKQKVNHNFYHTTHSSSQHYNNTTYISNTNKILHTSHSPHTTNFPHTTHTLNFLVSHLLLKANSKYSPRSLLTTHFSVVVATQEKLFFCEKSQLALHCCVRYVNMFLIILIITNRLYNDLLLYIET